MKSRKLLEKLNKLVGLGEGADKEEIKKLRKVLHALKDKQEKLKEKQGNETKNQKEKE